MRHWTRLRQILATAVLLCAPGVARAHGAEIVFLPIGHAIALVVVVVAALVVRVEWSARLIALLLAVAVGLPPYFVTNRYVPYWIAFSEVAWFLVGFLPPVVFSGAYLAWRRRARRATGRPAIGAKE